MASIKLNDAEQKCLRGLSLLARALYTVPIRERMNWQTGLVGADPRYQVRLQTLGDECGFVPDPGSTRRAWTPTRDEVRAARDELVRAGLIDRPSGYPSLQFVCRCLQADLGRTDQKGSPQGTPEEPPRGSPQEELHSGEVSEQSAPNEPPRNPQGGTPVIQGSGFREEEENTDMAGAISCPEPAAAVAEPAVISLPTNRAGHHHPITQTDIDQWAELYPAVDVLQQLRNMLGWLRTNTAKRKTARGTPRFVNNWLAKEQDRAPRAGEHHGQRSFPGRPATALERMQANLDAAEGRSPLRVINGTAERQDHGAPVDAPRPDLRR